MSWFGWHTVYPERIQLVWVALAIVGVLAWFEVRGRDALATFLSPIMQRRLTARATLERSITQLGLVLVCMFASIYALERPQAAGETETVVAGKPSADIMFVLDVSRSMLAEDASPNRLARAKAEIDQLVSRLDGQRVGLTVFAGRAVQMCPLTPDHSYFSTVLGTVDTRSAGKGGTQLGDAIKVALRGFPAGKGAKLIVLITDGDDQELAKDTDQEATDAKEAGVKIIAVGLGSETGSTITLTDPATGAKQVLMDHDGHPVISKLGSATLQKIALSTEGAYIPAGTSAIDLDAIMESHVRPIMAAAAEAATREIPAERFQWPVLIALLALLGALWVGAGAGERRTP